MIPLLITLALSISFGVNALGGLPNEQLRIKTSIAAIEKDVGDLTSPLALISSKRFLSLRESMDRETADIVVDLIRKRELTTTQSQIGLSLIAKIREEDYWEITSPLLSPNASDDLLLSILALPFPYGPCYAHAYTNRIYRAKLVGLKGDDRLGPRARNYLDFLLHGRAAHAYSDYLRHPERYGYQAKH